MRAPCWALSSTCHPHGQQLGKLRHNIGTHTQSTYKSQKIRSNIKPGKKKPIVNQQCIVQYTISSINVLRDPSDITLTFKILQKCHSKFDYLIYEMILFIKLRT